ncbi:hypothetical protein OR16_04527 [Cupriavidus basilensis OR16]|uniref:Uncharacterized protein n=2 Tax=Cupriavidus basilensis TaxID=68895 RepID=H1RZZ7_9BURK|nr:hypothetical protein OR16_04527 [Cupriavidus basilensis OR16]
MRGLAIRADYALAKVMHASYADSENEALDLCIALSDARCLGYRDYNNEEFDVPVMFADEPDLVSAWHDGQDQATRAQMDAWPLAARLVSYIESHSIPARVLPEGKIAALAVEVDRHGQVREQWENVEPNANAVRVWLGY